MKVTKSGSIEIMNKWGAEKIPFLFVIDFEMVSIHLFRLDQQLPEYIRYGFHDKISPYHSDSKEFRFIKFPPSFIEYEKAFKEIRGQILAGNSFLSNLTFATTLDTNLTLLQIYEISKAPYKLLFDGKFVCFSPETFITIKDGLITAKPMKGTINADLPNAEQVLMQSTKEIAEHHTIVDLLRNDLSMVAQEVMVKRFRYIDRIFSNEGSLLQVSSEITGKLPAQYHKNLGSILFTLLPAGSVTGAPKKQTLSILRKAEGIDRGYYTGVCGIFDGENLDSAVMIRFIELRGDGRMQFRSGGGITFLSIAEEEYSELIQKIYVPFA